MGLLANIGKRMDRQAHLMGAMMKRLDVDIESVGLEGDGARLQSAARSCLLCRDSDVCERWLEGAGDTPPDFCRNSQLFALHRKS